MHSVFVCRQVPVLSKAFSTTLSCQAVHSRNVDADIPYRTVLLLNIAHKRLFTCVTTHVSRQIVGLSESSLAGGDISSRLGRGLSEFIYLTIVHT
jgi:hypothetical protein